MMNAWHLLWIVPLAAAFGLLVGCMLSVAKQEDIRTLTLDAIESNIRKR